MRLAKPDRSLPSMPISLSLRWVLRRQRRRRSQDVTEAAPTDVRLDRIAVYASDEGEAEALFDYLRAQPVILLHSARAASRLAMLVTDRSSVPIAALSESVALAADKGWKSIAIAAQPNDEALLIAAKTLT
jgi:hypothetical protein